MIAPRAVPLLRGQLPDDAWLATVHAWRQDPIIWASLSRDELLLRLSGEYRDWPREYTPAFLALTMLDHSSSLAALLADPLQPCEVSLQSTCDRILSNLVEGNPDLQLALQTAVSLALDLRRMHLQQSNWDGISQYLAAWNKYSITVLACLFGVIPDQEGLLSSLLSTADSPAAMQIVLQAYLANPLPVGEHFRVLNPLLISLPPAQSSNVLKYLRQHHPELTETLSTAQLSPTSDGDFQATPPAGSLTQLLDHLEQFVESAKLHELSNHSEAATHCLTRALNTSKYIQAQLYARLARINASGFQSASSPSYPAIALEAWKRANQLARDIPDYAAGYATALIDSGNQDKARAFLDDGSYLNHHPSHPELLLAGARLAAHAGNTQESLLAALRALQEKQAAVVGDPDNLQQDHGFYIELCRLFLALNNPSAAALVASRALACHPYDNVTLTLAANAFLAAGEAHLALDASYLAWLQRPDTQHHSGYIAALEANAEWQAALQEYQALYPDLTAIEIDSLHAYAKCAILAGEFDLAQQTCQQALKLDPGNGIALGLLGCIAEQQGDLQLAAVNYQQATQAVPQSSEFWLALARLHGVNGDYAIAQETLLRACSANPESIPIHLALGKHFLSQNDATQALDHLQTAAILEAHPGNPSAGLHPKISRHTALPLGISLHSLGRDREARQVFEQALEAAPSVGIPSDFDPQSAQLDADYSVAYGNTLLTLGVVRPTLQLFEYALRFQPENMALMLNYAQASLLDTDQPAGAQRAAQTLNQILYPPDKVPYSDYPNLREKAIVLYAEAMVLCGDLEAASSAFQNAMETSLAEQPAWRSRICMGLGNTALALEQHETAITAFQESIQLDSGNPLTFRQLSRAYLAANLYSEAYHCAQTALDLDPDNLENLIWFSDQALRIEESPDTAHLRARPKIILSLHQAAHLAPQRADLLLKLGELQLLSGERQAAVTTFGTILETEASSEELQIAAEYLLHLGEYESALPLLDRAVRFYPQPTPSDSNLDHTQLTRALLELSDALKHMGNSNLALQTLEQALSLNPEDVTLLIAKADLLQHSGEIHDALSCLQDARRISPQNAEVHHHLALSYVQVGNYADALAHACQAVEKLTADTDTELRLSANLLAVRLAIALFIPGYARTVLERWTHIPETTAEGEPALPTDAAHLLLLRAGLSLDQGDSPSAASDLTKAKDMLPEHPHTQAVQLRLAVHQQGLIAVRKSLPAGWLDALLLEMDIESAIDPLAGADRLDTLKALTLAALELGDWRAVERLTRLLTAAAPDEVYSHFLTARCLVICGEVQRLCTAVQAVHSTPASFSIAEAHQAFREEIQSAKDCLERIQTSIPIDGLEISMGITSQLEESLRKCNLLQLRGQATFQPEPEAVEAFSTALAAVEASPEEVSALALAHGEIWDDLQALSAVRAYPRHPQVLVPAILILAHTNPRQALRVARSVVRSPHQPPAYCWPWTTFANAALAKLAYEAGEKSDDHNIAVQAIQNALADLPDEPRWHALAARIFMDERQLSGGTQLDAAIPHLQTAMQLEPDSAAHPLALGKVYQSQADYPAAIAAYQTGCHLDPQDAGVWLSLSTAQFAAGELNSAIYSADRAVERDDRSPATLENRGRLALAVKDPNMAIQCAQAILSREPEYPPAWQLLARAFQEVDQPLEALRALDHAVACSPEPKILQMERADLLHRTQGIETALVAWQELAERYPGDSLVLAGLARLEVEAGNTQAAVQAGRQALQADLGQLAPEDKLSLNCLIGQQLRIAGQPEEAISYLRDAIHQETQHIEAYLELGRAYQELRQTSQALSVYKEAMSIAPKNPWPYYHAGITLKDCKDYAEAENLLRRAAQLAPRDVNIHRQLGALVALNLIHNRGTLNMVE